MKILKFVFKYLGILIIGILFLFFLVSFLFYIFQKPSNSREWEFGQQKIQKVEIENENISIKDLRDYDWTNIWDEEKYKDIDFNIKDIKGLEVGVSHFSVNEGIGHVFLIFNLENGDDFALSIESRREIGEPFTLVDGLLSKYELIYILASKEDLISLREKRDERVYVYPMKIDEEKAQNLFLLISDKINALFEKPEFYHLFLGNCTNLIVKEVEKISENNFPFYEKTFAPGYAGRALFEMNLIDTDLNIFEEVKEKYLVKFN